MITFEKIEQNGVEWFGKRYHLLTSYQKGVVFYEAFKKNGVTQKSIAEAVNMSPYNVGKLISLVHEEVQLYREKGFRKPKIWNNGA